MIRVIDFLLENRIFDYSKAEIARHSGISRTTLDLFWKKLIKDGIIKKSRTIGRATLYRFNPNSEISKKLIELDFVISKQYAEKLAEPEEVPLKAWFLFYATDKAAQVHNRREGRRGRRGVGFWFNSM